MTKVEDTFPPEDFDLELRQWALDRAIECAKDERADRIVAMAGKFVDFVMGTNDAEVVRAARELADKVKE